VPVRINSIHKPSDEMRELRQVIEDEAALRASIRLQSSPEYVEDQLERLDAAIAALEAQKAGIRERRDNADTALAASEARSDTARRRYALLKHRNKINRFEKLLAKIDEIKSNLEEN